MRYISLQEQTLYNAVTFRRLLDSFARPGKINQLEYPHFLGQPPRCHVQTQATAMNVNLYALGAMLTLLDREVTFAVAADAQWLSNISPVVQWLALRSGSTLAPPAFCTFAFFCQGRHDGLITQLSRGTQLAPESSTTAFYCVEQLTEGTREPGASPDRVTLELTGPGIEHIHRVSVTGLAKNEIALINLARHGYPLGIDIYLIDPLGRCVGLPRTTHIHIIEKEMYNGVCRS